MNNNLALLGFQIKNKRKELLRIVYRIRQYFTHISSFIEKGSNESFTCTILTVSSLRGPQITSLSRC